MFVSIALAHHLYWRPLHARELFEALTRSRRENRDSLVLLALITGRMLD